MVTRRTLGGLGLGLLVLPWAAACTPSGSTPSTPRRPGADGPEPEPVLIESRHPKASKKYGEDRVRHDLEPLTKRFPKLGTLTKATWMGGVMSHNTRLGPNDIWIDAVIEVTPDSMVELRATEIHEALQQPTPVAKVEDALPKGTLFASQELDAMITSDGTANVWLVEGTNTLLLQHMTR